MKEARPTVRFLRIPEEVLPVTTAWDSAATLERFVAKVEFGDCWQWLASCVSWGYGTFWDGEGHRRAHRWAYRYWNGELPPGTVIDHLCRNRGCVNPDHLEAVTPRVNTLRGIGPAAQNHRKTHCIHGHEFNDENTYVDPRGRRLCRPCRRAQWASWEASKRGKRP